MPKVAAKFLAPLKPPGGWHDNDHTDIFLIKVMPTLQETQSTRSEYLPPRDPSQWQLDGIHGLPDRHFRLLREDTIGQLRDAIHSEIVPSSGGQGNRNNLRTHAYRNQLRRLQSSALVFLTDYRTCAVLCSVLGPSSDRVKNEGQNQLGPSEGDEPSLWSNKALASITLGLVEADGENIRRLLQAMATGRATASASLSLVEFPGVLLPSFQPTLCALQQIKKSARLPFADILTAAGAPDMQIPPPRYASRPGFFFDLQGLTKDHSPLNLYPGRPFDIQDLQRNCDLDEAQAEALVNSLTRELGLIQGPPGTGKSYTGVALVKQGRSGPDNLLETKITSQVIRIGSQSKSEVLKPLNLRNVAKDFSHTRFEKRAFSARDFRGLLENHSIAKHLKERHPLHYHHLFEKNIDGWDRYSSRGSNGAIGQWLHQGRQNENPSRSIQELQYSDLETMTTQERRNLHASWLEEIRSEEERDITLAILDHRDAKLKFDDVRDEMNLQLLQSADVIGITTSGLARNLKFLQRLQSKVVICEEAGEVLEVNLLTALLPSVQQAILIGDHLQLRSQIQNYDLSSENPRGVDKNAEDGAQVPFNTLETQRRMHPSIAHLIRKTLYPRLSDAPSVCVYPEVMGMRRRLFWLDHRAPEAGSSGDDALATSHWNQHEIQLTAALIKHLTSQGTYKKGDIAVLTSYLGQLHRLRREIGQFTRISMDERDEGQLDKAGLPDNTKLENKRISKYRKFIKTTLLESVRVATVDNFQGGEAKVIVISLVRSNSQNKCARHGMYIIGNSATSAHVPMWADVIKLLESNDNFGTELELRCPRHPDTPIFTLHSAVYCLEDCPRPLKGCDYQCPKKCGDQCVTKCTVKVHDPHRVLGVHAAPYLKCWEAQNLSNLRCTVRVDKTIPGCNHKVSELCYVDMTKNDYKCKKQCSDYAINAFLVMNQEPFLQIMVLCTQNCGRGQSTCSHSCGISCHGEKPCPPCNKPCDFHCGHSKYGNKYHELCIPCAEDICLSACPRSKCSMPCSAPCGHAPCSKRCEKKLPCGPSVCGESCPPIEFCQICASEDVKHRAVDFILGETYEEIDLNENPCIFPQCHHFLTMESMDGLFDWKKRYNLDTKGFPISIASSSEPFSIDDVKRCATCRGSLRDIARYGRLVRRALRDECTKKFILYSNNEYIPIATNVSKHLASLQDDSDFKFSAVFDGTKIIRIEGPCDNQVRMLSNLLARCKPSRWSELMPLRKRLLIYLEKVSKDEQPSTNSTKVFCRIRGFLMAAALLIRLDTALIADFLSLRRKGLSRKMALDSEIQLIHKAASSNRAYLQVEGHIFLAELYALERGHRENLTQPERMMEYGTIAVERARRLCQENPGQTTGLSQEVDEAEKMVNQGTLYTAVTNAERLAVIEAMAGEFRGTGHWYFCVNRHPFTIGECGMPMQQARCPECGAPVGGQHHQQVEGRLGNLST
ncbi:hypothetical protein BGW36DRAFT_414157 [Talaromyces proteolyticus]|uniref:RZ-type domain-containing protein n=1 Tax=Talaromyces proteolyticus TaxID=1131652 RepID=A0AAD4Q054_9EURO|nr:uncharacterized protein BGW36DRAFT_414157 [Talaromyces proteolyticus]KAH8703728.1 hypothetical protein BGW36DRAFT_414157 [Talaromyces proteolyticus]